MCPGGIPTFKGITSPAVQNFPRRVQSSPPGKLESISPSSKLIPSRFWKLIPRRARTRLPALFKELFPYQDITGLSSAKSHGKIVLGKVFLSPAESVKTSNITTVSPASYQPQQSTSLSPQSISPQSNLSTKFIPQRSHLLLPVFLHSSSPAETTKLYSSNISPGFNFPASVKDLLS